VVGMERRSSANRHVGDDGSESNNSSEGKKIWSSRYSISNTLLAMRGGIVLYFGSSQLASFIYVYLANTAFV
jgi:hypothetical protein